jgi:DnaJ family protein A protein 2
MFFGGGGSRRGPRKGESINHPIKVSLEDLYNSKTVKLAINRQVIVGDKQAKVCDTCEGQGVVMELRQIALGMVQQVQRKCTAPGCIDGYVYKTKKERKVLEVHVEKGMKNGQKITFRGMADEKPNMETGDINFIVQEKEHELFKRKGADLLISKTLSLNEALCGFEWSVTHLDKREVIIK